MTTNNKWEEEIRNKDLNGWNNWLIKLIQLEKEESYQRGKEETLEKVKEVMQKELETWAKESIGANAVKSVMMALQELNKLKEKINNNFEAVADNSERGFNDGLNQGRQETLEKVKEVIEKKYEKSIGELSLEEINIIEGILQELNNI